MAGTDIKRRNQDIWRPSPPGATSASRPVLSGCSKANMVATRPPAELPTNDAFWTPNASNNLLVKSTVARGS